MTYPTGAVVTYEYHGQDPNLPSAVQLTDPGATTVRTLASSVRWHAYGRDVYAYVAGNGITTPRRDLRGLRQGTKAERSDPAWDPPLTYSAAGLQLSGDVRMGS